MYTKNMRPKKPIQGKRTGQKYKPSPKLTPKQNRMLKEKIERGTTNREAYIKAYNANNMKLSTIDVEASRTLNLPHVKSELSKYNNLIEETIINNISRYKDSEDIQEVKEANLNARWVHDKIHGQATKRTESTSVNIEATIDQLRG